MGSSRESVVTIGHICDVKKFVATYVTPGFFAESAAEIPARLADDAIARRSRDCNNSTKTKQKTKQAS
jgi:hypothetical protein